MVSALFELELEPPPAFRPAFQVPQFHVEDRRLERVEPGVEALDLVLVLRGAAVVTEKPTKSGWNSTQPRR